MKTLRSLLAFSTGYIVFFFLLISDVGLFAAVNRPLLPDENNPDSYIVYKGLVVDQKTGETLSFASLTLVGANISVVTNSEGQFALKLPKSMVNPRVTISYLGYKSKQVALPADDAEKLRIGLESTVVQLPELSVVSKDATELIRAVMEKKGVNYVNAPTLMTAFYREIIKKNKSYASLAEAVVEINKQPYNSVKSDVVRLFKSRKRANYARLDTVTFKLMGGPFNSLYLDVMKNPDMLFTDDMLANYEFSFDRSTYEDKKMIYIIDFKQRSTISDPLYYGKLYIDAQSLALRSAVFSLNLSNRDEVAKMYVMRKPANARVYPVATQYRIDYRQTDGKWYYGYSRIELALKINWKKKLFNTTYYSTVEMAVTDWGMNAEKKSSRFKDHLKPTVVISDEASGFSDPEFWGDFNVIEPEKSIDNAIRKIQKQLEKEMVD